MPTLPAGLEALVEDLDPEAFLEDTWERRARVMQARDPDLFQRLYTLRDLEARVRLAPVPESQFRLYREGKVLPREEYLEGGRVDWDRVWERVQDGCSINADGLHRHNRRLRWYVRTVEGTFGCPINVNMYYTPPGSRAADPHYDFHSILVTQTRGSKCWRLAARLTRECPVRGIHDNREEPPPLDQPVRLEAGQLLYLPRGLTHVAWCEDHEDSIHLTVGFHPLTWLELLKRQVDRSARDRSALRRALRVDAPAGDLRRALRQALHTVREDLDAEGALSGLRSIAGTSYLDPAPQADLRPPDGRAVTPDSRLRPLKPLRWTVHGESLRLGHLELYADLAEALRAVRDPFTPADLPLPEERAVLLCHHLRQNDRVDFA